jgi:hypothetical protein
MLLTENTLTRGKGAVRLDTLTVPRSSKARGAYYDAFNS